MGQKLSRSAQKKIDYLVKLLDSTRTSADRLLSSEPAITDFVRRSAIPSYPDGYPTSTALGEKSSGSGSSNTPTEGALLARHPEWREDGTTGKVRPKTDPVQAQARRFEQLVGDAEFAIKSALGLLQRLNVKIEEQQQRPTSVPCLVCQELPAEVSGMDRRCYDNWRDHGQPDRERWVMYKRGLTNNENPPLPLVPTCPPPSEGHHARRGPWK